MAGTNLGRDASGRLRPRAAVPRKGRERKKNAGKSSPGKAGRALPFGNSPSALRKGSSPAGKTNARGRTEQRSRKSADKSPSEALPRSRIPLQGQRGQPRGSRIRPVSPPPRPPQSGGSSPSFVRQKRLGKDGRESRSEGKTLPGIEGRFPEKAPQAGTRGRAPAMIRRRGTAVEGRKRAGQVPGAGCGRSARLRKFRDEGTFRLCVPGRFLVEAPALPLRHGSFLAEASESASRKVS